MALIELMDERFSSDSKYYFDVKWTLNRIILPACNALAQAHSANLYHRDLKLNNIMFNDPTTSSIKITDWGLVKIEDPIRSKEKNSDFVSSPAVDDLDRKSLELTAMVGEGGVGGTPDYCSPEQWFASAQKNSESIDGRTDIFSLGIIFYEMLTRTRPTPYDPNKPNLARPPIELPSWRSPQLRQSIAKMIELDPKDRQHSIWDLLSEIETTPENSL